MSRRTNIINAVLTLILTFGALFAVVYVCDYRYAVNNIFSVLVWVVIGAVLAGVLNTFVHEFAHLTVGKINGFAFSSIQILFFKWQKQGKKVRFCFAPIHSEAGYTEMIPTSTESLAKRYRRMALAGSLASLFLVLIGVVPFFIKGISVQLFCIWAVFVPMSIYSLLSNLLPSSSYGTRNDGGVAYGLRVMDDSSKVMLALLNIQAEMYSGKTPAEVDEKYYFDLPQLAEDDPTFMMLLNARYNYYLDKGDYAKAKQALSRLLSLEEYMPKYFMQVAKTDLLYGYCTFNFDEEKADDVTYELEKYLNNVNTASTLRVKIAYLLYVKRERESLDMFFNKALKEADRVIIKGYGAFERKLIEKMKEDF